MPPESLSLSTVADILSGDAASRGGLMDKNEAAAKKFLDWALSQSAMKEYAKFKLGVAYPGIPGPKGLPALATIKLAPMDFAWQSKNRSKILEVWQGHFLK